MQTRPIIACSLKLTSQLLQRLHKLHQAARYRKALTPAQKTLFEQKLLLSQVRTNITLPSDVDIGADIPRQEGKLSG